MHKLYKINCKNLMINKIEEILEKNKLEPLTTQEQDYLLLKVQPHKIKTIRSFIFIEYRPDRNYRVLYDLDILKEFKIK